MHWNKYPREAVVTTSMRNVQGPVGCSWQQPGLVEGTLPMVPEGQTI